MTNRFRSEDMTKIGLFAMLEDRQKILSNLHKGGLLEITKISDELSSKTKKTSATETHEKISDHLIHFSHLQTILELAKTKKSFTQNILGYDLIEKVSVPEESTDELLERTETFLDRHQKEIVKAEERYLNFKTSIEEYTEHAKIIKLFSKLKTSLHVVRDTKHTKIIFGTINPLAIENLRKNLRKKIKDRYELIHESVQKTSSVFLLIVLKEDSSNAESIIKSHNGNILLLPKFEDVTNESEKELLIKKPNKFITRKIRSFQDEMEKAVIDITKLRTNFYEEVVVFKELLQIEEEKTEALHKFGDTQKTFVLEGWVESSKVNQLKNEINSATSHDFELIKIKSESMPPTKTSNPKKIKVFEMLVDLYSTPKYKDLDPTFIVGPLFIIYAGFMLTDFVYGFGCFLLGFYLYKSLGKYNEGLKGPGMNILLMGAAAMFFGILTGSYLGDAPKYFFGLSTEQLAIWRDPLADPLYFLIISLAVGFIHLNIGLVMGLIEDIRKKDWKSLISERAIWFALQIGIALWYFKFGLLFAKILLGITLIVIIIYHGPIGLLGITGFMGDIISYARLFALALSTAGIAMTVNLLTELVKGAPFIGFIGATLIFVGGHAFSFLMNSLGAFVHSIRLQFVEFFGKFYEGGGEKFSPFKEKRLYTVPVSKKHWAEIDYGDEE